MKIGIIGYDIFGTGGTKRSNINLINEFLKDNHQVTYFNLMPFTKRSIKKISNEIEDISSMTFRQLRDFEGTNFCDIYIITRESLFVFSKIIKTTVPEAVVIGEIHTPLQLIDVETDFSVQYIDYYRVATKNIMKELEVIVPKEKMFCYPVSVNHLNFSKKKVVTFDDRVNFLIFSRFDEQQKDIIYAIRLIEYFVNNKKKKNYFLYLNGNGAFEKVYRKLIKFYNLENYIFINSKIPDNTVYFSTARCETLGYSILEAFSEGKPVILYKGDDNSLIDIYGNFNSIGWLNKNLEHDAEKVNEFVSQNRGIRQELYEQDLMNIESVVHIDAYAKNYLINIKQHLSTNEINNKIFTNEILKIINIQNNLQDKNFLLKIYLKLKELPLIGSVIGSNLIKETMKKILSLKKQNVYKETSLMQGQLRDDFVFIESFHGKSFAGDPKYFALFLKKQFPHLNFFVSSVNEFVDAEILNFGMIPIRIGSNRYVEKFRKSKLVIVNGNTLDKVGKVKNQIFIQTWHGFPLKRMVADLENLEERKKEKEAFIPRMKKWDYLLTSSLKNLELFEGAFCLKKNKNLQRLTLGAPRNSYLLSNIDNIDEKERVHLKYFNRPWTSSKKYILYCPTWRKNKRTKVSQLNLLEIIKKLPEDYELIIKLHPLESDLVDYYNSIDQRITSFPNEFSDIQELFLVSDTLITDYSSAMFDYAHMNKKIIVLQEDSKEYKEKIGWYFNLYKETGISAKRYTEDELVAAVLETSQDFYNQRIISQFLNKDSIDTNYDIMRSLKNERGEKN